MATARCEQWCALSSSQYSCKVRKDSANYTQRYSSFENLNISETKQDIEKLKAPLSLVRKCCSVAIACVAGALGGGFGTGKVWNGGS